ncbi:Na+/H+ antiporter NhaC [Halobacteriovorax sp. HLS]|uniref:Na+/H+ antiporter NhaC n=1 Tax=Halobacteriovorax sp. HLS TaxID=2234000 RepID=UPI000FD863A6|nr:Na+/H+ antiporter NhaC [Halobacteriovorax sp. HLS]
MHRAKKPGLILSLVPVFFLVFLLIINVLIFKDDATGGANQVALLFAAFVTGLIGIFKLKVPYHHIETKISSSINMALSALTILLVVGALIGVWILSGTVPAMIYYGLKLINPSVFLPVACVICCIVSLATGSSWSTTGTVGIALVGIGQTLGIADGAIAGAVISGAYFGDKMSPLSDTTNLAPAIAGSELFEHIRHMMFTSGPAIIISIIGFTILGLTYDSGSMNTEDIALMLKTIESRFDISFFMFIPPIAVLLLVRKKVPALPAIACGVFIGVITALIFQRDMMIELMSGKSSIKDFYTLITTVSYQGFSMETGSATVDKLLNRGGMSGMLSTVWLIFSAMVFGGTLDATGMLAKISASILHLVKGTGSLIGATLGSCIVLNATASDQYLAIVVPGKMFRKAYEKYGLDPRNLSRALEDAGTVTSVLIPWNSGGAYNAATLGIPTLTYLPYCFFNILSPIISLFLATMNWTIIKKIEEKS